MAAASGPRPTGSRIADLFWSAAFGLAVPLVASRARRWALIWAAGVAAAVGVSGDTGGKVAAGILVVLLVALAVSRRRDRVLAAVVGATAVQALLRGPDVEPVWLLPLVAVVALGPLVWSARRMARSHERRVATRIIVTTVALAVILGAAAGVAAVLARPDLQQGADEAISGLDVLRSGDSPLAAQRFDQSAASFDEAGTTLSSPLTWGGRILPVVGQHVTALDALATAGTELAASAAETASTADYRTLTSDSGTVDLARVGALRAPVADAAATIDDALGSVAAVRSPWLLGPVGSELDRFDERLADVADQTSIAAQALAVAPTLLGADGPKRYFLAFSTPAESRDGGGFIGAYGLLTVDAGRFDLVEAGSLGALNRDGPYAFTPPPDWDLRYGSLLVERFLGNLGASPDWPIDTDVAAQLFPQTPGGLPVDGALYVDPAALAGLLELTGPVTLPDLDLTVDATTVESFLLRDQYARFGADDLSDNDQRRELLGAVAEATFDALIATSLPGIDDLTRTLGPLVDAGHLRLSTFDEPAEQLLDRVGLSGAWDPQPGADLLSVRSTNTLANKIDAYLFRDIAVDTMLDPAAGTLRSSVRVDLRNDAPTSGLPDYVIGNGDDLPTGTNRTMVTVHSPHRLEVVTLDGEAVPVQTQREFGQPVYSVVVELAPGATRSLEFRLAGALPGESPYRLQVLPQATANPDQLSVRIAPTGSTTPTGEFRGPLRGPVLVGAP
ncbi:MAG: DUF4012 domain-containing protein [Acidimicrobiales bacterium]|nr:DUF4012 domain-containing protein [Acidimicrobiales bacterium]